MMLAQGCYSYHLDGQLQAIREPWTLQQSDSGLRLQGQRCVDDQPVLQAIADYQGSRCYALQLTWQSSPDSAARRFDYQLDDAGLHWCEQPQNQQLFALPTPCHLFPLLRAASGVLLPQLQGHGGSVVLPNLRQPQKPDFLQPLVSQRRSQLLASDIKGVQQFAYFGGEYGDQGSDYWLNPQGFVQRYRWLSGHGEWDVQLEEFSCRANFQTWQQTQPNS